MAAPRKPASRKRAHTPPRPPALRGGLDGKLAKAAAAQVRQLSLREQAAVSAARLRKRLSFAVRLDEYSRVLDLAEAYGESPETVQRAAFRRGLEILQQWPGDHQTLEDGDLFVRRPSRVDPTGRRLPGAIERPFQQPTEDFEAGRGRSAADPERVRTTPLSREQVYDETETVFDKPAPRELLPSGATDERALPPDRPQAGRRVPEQAHVPAEERQPSDRRPMQAHPSRRPEPLPNAAERAAARQAELEREAPSYHQQGEEDTVQIGPPKGAKVSVVSLPSRVGAQQEPVEEPAPEVSPEAAQRIQDAAAEEPAPPAAKPKRSRTPRKRGASGTPPADTPVQPGQSAGEVGDAAALQHVIETTEIADLL